jgi:hypothetical protein
MKEQQELLQKFIQANEVLATLNLNDQESEQLKRLFNKIYIRQLRDLDKKEENA